MQSLDPTGHYSPDAVTAALRGASGSRTIAFRYDRLGADMSYLGPCTTITAGSIAYDSLADIKRSAKLALLDDGTIDFLKDRIKPWVRLLMPDGGWVEWPQGVFLLSTPTRTLKTSGTVTRAVDAYDQLVILKGDLVADRYTVAAGTAYTDAIAALTSDLPYRSIAPSSLALANAMEWDPGTSRLAILNALLGAINYRSAWFDENGSLICEPYVAPDTAAVEFTYATDSTSVITGDIDDTIDLYSIPNRWVLVVSNPESDPIVSRFTNTAASSPTSTVNRGRVITDFRTEQDAADQATLDAKVARLAYEASQVFESIDFETAIMPIHSDSDVLGIVVNGLGLSTAKFSEQSWEFELKVGATMSHKIRRTVSVA